MGSVGLVGFRVLGLGVSMSGRVWVLELGVSRSSRVRVSGLGVSRSSRVCGFCVRGQ